MIVKASDVTINLGCRDDPGTIFGSRAVDTIDAWNGPNERGHYVLRLFREPGVVALDDELLTPAGIEDLGPGQYAVSANESRSSFLLHIAVDPAGHVFEVGQRRFGIQIGHSERSVVKGLTVLGGGKGAIKYVGAGNPSKPKGLGIAVGSDVWPADNFGGAWKIDGVNFYGILQQAIHTFGSATPQTLTITNCSVMEIGGEGIYIKSVEGKVVISHNRIGNAKLHHFGWDGHGTAYAGDAIDLGGSARDAVMDAEVSYNTIVNVRGDGINIKAKHGRVTNNEIVDAYLENAKQPKACLRVDPVYAFSRIDVHANFCRNARGDAVIIRGRADAGHDLRFSSNTLIALDGSASVVRFPARNASGVSFRNNTLSGRGCAVRFTPNASPARNLEFSHNLFVGIRNILCVEGAYDPATLTFNANALVGAEDGNPGFMYIRGESLSLDVFEDGLPNAARNLIESGTVREDGEYSLDPGSRAASVGGSLDWPMNDRFGRRFVSPRPAGSVQP